MKKWVVGLACLIVLSSIALLVASTEQREASSVTGAAIADERLSSGDLISVNKIAVYEDKVILGIENATITKFTNTNSMDPTFDEGANGIEVVPIKEELEVGDVVSYYSSIVGGVVVHRIIEIGEDEQGTYYVLKGDNNQAADPQPIRFEQIEGLVVGILY